VASVLKGIQTIKLTTQRSVGTLATARHQVTGTGAMTLTVSQAAVCSIAYSGSYQQRGTALTGAGGAGPQSHGAPTPNRKPKRYSLKELYAQQDAEKKAEKLRRIEARKAADAERARQELARAEQLRLEAQALAARPMTNTIDLHLATLRTHIAAAEAEAKLQQAREQADEEDIALLLLH